MPVSEYYLQVYSVFSKFTVFSKEILLLLVSFWIFLFHLLLQLYINFQLEIRWWDRSAQWTLDLLMKEGT